LQHQNGITSQPSEQKRVGAIRSVRGMLRQLPGHSNGKGTSATSEGDDREVSERPEKSAAETWNKLHGGGSWTYLAVTNVIKST
jgi:hypothetical protein